MERVFIKLDLDPISVIAESWRREPSSHHRRFNFGNFRNILLVIQTITKDVAEIAQCSFDTVSYRLFFTLQDPIQYTT